jgi:hypothetical protein
MDLIPPQKVEWFRFQNPKIRPKKMHFPGYLISGRTQSNLHSNVYHSCLIGLTGLPHDSSCTQSCGATHNPRNNRYVRRRRHFVAVA